MAAEKIEINRFIEMAQYYPVLDVRSPSEYNHAHIPGAHSLPLFTDDQRRIVGTSYKQQSRKHAIKIGLDFFGPNMRGMVEEVEKIVAERKSAKNGETEHATILVHCWRGGMRSAAVAWLLDLYGFKVYTLAGGYKKFRHFVLDKLKENFPLTVLGGYTGSGKSKILEELKKKGEIVVDLESLANHKGSAFGAHGQPPQPSQEMFENLLAVELWRSMNKIRENENSGKPYRIWIEDESQRIGLINLPQEFWLSLRRSPVFFIDIPFEERLNYIVKEYGWIETEKMVNAIIRIKKRLGGLETKTAVNCLLEGNIPGSFEVLLKYYDKHYKKGLNNRDDLDSLLTVIPCSNLDHSRNSKELLQVANAAITQ
jgi:tRNA 2-selenouridine synthase